MSSSPSVPSSPLETEKVLSTPRERRAACIELSNEIDKLTTSLDASKKRAEGRFAKLEKELDVKISRLDEMKREMRAKGEAV